MNKNFALGALTILASICIGQAINPAAALAAKIDVTKYGYKGDDRTDNQGFERAFAAAKAGDIVYFPAGKFHHSLEIKANGVNLEGNSAATSQIIGDAVGKSAIKLGGNNSSVSKLTIAYKLKGTTAKEYAGVWVDKATNFSVNNCVLTNPSAPGVFIVQSSNGIVNNNKFNTCQPGVALTQLTTNTKVQTNEFIGGAFPIWMSPTIITSSLMRNITIDDNTIHGIFGSSGSMVITAVDGCNITNNKIQNEAASPNGGYMQIAAGDQQSSFGAVKNIAISKNTLVRCGANASKGARSQRASIWVFADRNAKVTNVKIDNNNISASPIGGIAVMANSTDTAALTTVNISQNTIKDCGLLVVTISPTRPPLVFIGKDPAIVVKNTKDCTVANNTISNNSSSAILVGDNNSNKVTVNANTLSNCGSGNASFNSVIGFGANDVPAPRTPNPVANAALKQVIITNNTYSGTVAGLSYFVDDQVSKAKVPTTFSGNVASTNPPLPNKIKP